MAVAAALTTFHSCHDMLFDQSDSCCQLQSGYWLGQIQTLVSLLGKARFGMYEMCS
jgi:hypothetical protein